MKHYKLFVLVIILVLCFPSVVFGASFSVKVSYNRSSYHPHVYAINTSSQGTKRKYFKKGGTTYYVQNLSTGIFKAVRTSDSSISYPAICIDPNYVLNKGSSLKCSKVTDSDVDTDAIKYVMKDLTLDSSDTDWLIATTAVRYFAYPVSHKNVWAKSIHKILKQKKGDTIGIGEYDTCTEGAKNETCYEKALDSFLSGKTNTYTNKIIEEIKAAQEYSKNLNNSKSNDDEEFTLSFVPGEPNDDGLIKILVNASPKATSDITFECKSNCEFVRGNMYKGAAHTYIYVKIAKGECPETIKYTIGYKYKSNNANTTKDTVYHCKDSGTNNQTFILIDSEKNEEYIEDKTQLKYSCTDECNPPNIKEDKYVNMCCNDNNNKESYVIEPLIKNLFCNKIEKVNGVVKYSVPGFGVSEKASDDYKEKKVNTYCVVYCTERLHIKIPDAKTGNNGKYFKFEGSNDYDKGPYFNGYKTCRIRIRYDKWQSDYVKATESVIGLYNTYQVQQALANSYRDAYETLSVKSYTEDSTGGTATYKGWISKTGCDDGGATCEVKDEDLTCKFKYRANLRNYTFPSYTYTNVEAAALDENTSWTDGKKLQNFKGFKIVSGTSDTTSGDKINKYLDAYWSDDDCGSADKKTCSTTCVHTFEVTCTDEQKKAGKTKCYDTENLDVSGKVPRTDISRSFGANMSSDDLKKKWTNNQSTADTYNSNYQSAADGLKTYEDLIEECDTYFDSGKKGYSGKKNYDTKPDVVFHYTQIYVDNTQGSIVSHVNDKPFTVTCDYYDAVVATNSNDKDLYNKDLGLEEPHYNEVTPSLPDNASITNFNYKINESDDNSAHCTSSGGKSETYGCAKGNLSSDLSLRTVSQKYTTDAYYRVECKSNGENNDTYTLYPYGSFSKDYYVNSTYRNAQYYIEYSQLEGNFLTYWEFKNLGTDGKFDQSFTEEETCSENFNMNDFIDTSGLSCTYTVKSSLTRISACDEDAIINSNNFVHYCCDGDDECPFTGEDIVTYAFKSVDPNNMFPDGGKINGDGDKYAANWLKTNDGTNAYAEITRTAKADKTYSNDRITYEFNLNIMDLEKIRTYNEKVGTYGDSGLKCDCVGTEDAVKGCIGYLKNCYSTFIGNWYESGKIQTNSYIDTVSNSLGTSALTQARSRTHFSS